MFSFESLFNIVNMNTTYALLVPIFVFSIGKQYVLWQTNFTFIYLFMGQFMIAFQDLNVHGDDPTRIRAKTNPKP
jgi:hypothetical protein